MALSPCGRCLERGKKSTPSVAGSKMTAGGKCQPGQTERERERDWHGKVPELSLDQCFLLNCQSTFSNPADGYRTHHSNSKFVDIIGLLSYC